MDIKKDFIEALKEHGFTPGGGAKLAEAEGKLAEAKATIADLEGKLKVAEDATSASGPLLATLAEAGIDSAEKLQATLAGAKAFSAQVDAKLAAAKIQLTALHKDAEADLKAEIAMLEALEVGPVLDRQLARIEAEYDAKFGTNGKTVASRTSAPTPSTKVATDAADTATLELTDADKEKAQAATHSAF